jgi:hypothetical protein
VAADLHERQFAFLDHRSREFHASCEVVVGPHFMCPSKPSSVASDCPARAAHNGEWVCPRVSKLWPRCGHVRDRSARVPGPMPPTVRPQSTPCRLRFTLSQTRTISAKRAEVHQNLSRRPSPRGTATRRWSVRCRRGHHGVQTRGVRAADHGIEDERHACLRALSRSVGTADGVPGHGSVSVAGQLCCQSRRGWPGSAH